MPASTLPPPADTIAAISTPPGRGGIGIVRLSGPDACRIAAWLTESEAPLQHARARYTRVLDRAAVRDGASADRAVLDEAVVTAFHAPHSYTGEDVVEIATHGAPVILDAVLRGALAAGARLAEPGEFTQRAFEAGRLDLTQAEAVHDLIAARTLDQARQAAQQLGGALSRRLAPAKDRLVHLIALLEAGMDFASGELDDVEVVAPDYIATAIGELREELSGLAATFHRGHLLRQGASVALVGLPNAGKSSLFNRLLERERAIVTPIAGTTRDTVEESLALAGIPLRLIDTAGLRGDALAAVSKAGHPTSPPADEAERLGIERSREALADADMVLLVHDSSVAWTATEDALLQQLLARPHVLVNNKADLPAAKTRPAEPANALSTTDEAAPAPHSASPAPHSASPAPNAASSPHSASPAPNSASPAPQAWPAADPAVSTTVSLSARTGEGIEELRAAMLRLLQAEGGAAEGAAITTHRQQDLLLGVLSALAQAAEANQSRLPHEILLMDLHAALNALDALTGQTTTEEILGRIFSTFCIGK